MDIKVIGLASDHAGFALKQFVKKYLEEKGEETVIIAGLQTNYCIDASIKSAFDRDFGVIVPEGCNSTFDNDYMTGETTYRYYNEDVWEAFAYLVSIEEAFEVEE